MSWWTDILSVLFQHTRGLGTPADQKPHDARDDETTDSATGIGEEDGQLLDNTSIDPAIQDKEKGFPTDNNPTRRFGDTL